MVRLDLLLDSHSNHPSKSFDGIVGGASFRATKPTTFPASSTAVMETYEWTIIEARSPLSGMDGNRSSTWSCPCSVTMVWISGMSFGSARRRNTEDMVSLTSRENCW